MSRYNADEIGAGTPYEELPDAIEFVSPVSGSKISINREMLYDGGYDVETGTFWGDRVMEFHIRKMIEP